MSSEARITGFDVLRGFSVVSMVGFHLCYDLTAISGVSLPWFSGPFESLWRASISWLFLWIAGCMCSYSRNNWRRGVQLLAAATLIWVITSATQLDTPVSFGIIFCIGASTLIAAVLQETHMLPKGIASAAVLFLLFIATQSLPRGFFGFGPLSFPMPRGLYALDVLSFLGFPGPTFVSGDYYPLLPYTLLFLSGAVCGQYFKKHDVPSVLKTLHFVPLELVGRHALAIYLLHQPLLVGMLMLMGMA